MKIICVGGGPGGLYSALLLKARHPGHDIEVIERNRRGETFGFGVVFSDQTLGNLEAADGPTFKAITDAFAHWSDIDIHFKGQTLTSTGHGFAGMGRQALLTLLEHRCEELGVKLSHGRELKNLDEVAHADLIICADGVNSASRERLAPQLGPHVDWRPNRFIWLGTTVEFEAFKFYFKRSEHGLFRVHAYRYAPGQSTFIVETTEQTWRAAGLDTATEDDSVAFCEALFAEELGGHRLLKNRSIWRQFPTISCDRWYHKNLVIIGDAAHTAHFSIGSGTKLAMEDAIVLADALDSTTDIPLALKAYDQARRPQVASVQRAAQVSLEWFESTERYYDRLEPIQFAFSLLTRSLRITHENLRLRDPAFVKRVDAWFEGDGDPDAPRPPMFTPLTLRGLTLPNRIVVSPMCMYSARDGVVDDWHLVHLASRAIGGAGLIMAEMTDVTREGRITRGCAGLYQDAHIAAWGRIVDFIHERSQAKVGIQLGHAGRKGSTTLPWEGDKPLEGDVAWPLIGPSPLPYAPGWPTPRPMNRDDMDALIEAYVASAHRAEAAGFDLLELHAAHGYLLSTFISPLTNHRDDRYGGSLENRLRFPLEVFAAVREAWPQHKPMSVRISATDWAPGGIGSDEAVAIAAAFAALGADIIDVSAGQVVSDQAPRYGRLFQTPFSDRIRLEVGIPTMTVGNISTFEDVNAVLAAGRADLCAMARVHLYDPYWTRHAAAQLGYGEQAWPEPYEVMQTYKPRL